MRIRYGKINMNNYKKVQYKINQNYKRKIKH